ncbi:putative trichothecene biosynthesis protein [Ophiocordyceps camponoti-floridani]|uniref:Putative trichothecene biosynthesis protein n=1 Tax=Ophiocordyceps camponoti-floridani TaxID=2030778 RepID=A0A8H4VGT0_9HYPO|nr:putative trichothecene biosynthesis protein [Ophiocordyceps camponoti-floridani]
MTRLLSLLLLASPLLALSNKVQTSDCNDFGAHCNITPGDRIVDGYRLYPENASFDSKTCLVYFSSLWNNTIAIYDAVHNKIVGSIDYPFGGRQDLHANAVLVDSCNRELTAGFTSAYPWDTQGARVDGPNFIAQYDLDTHELLWTVDLSKPTNYRYGGFQDVAQDRYGNLFVAGTYPAALVRIDAKTRAVEPWYLSSANSTTAGYSGLAMFEFRKLLVSDQSAETGSNLVSFDVDVKRPSRPRPIPVTWASNGTLTGISIEPDAIVLAPKYRGKVLLVADNSLGTVVLYSDDGWVTAKKLGVVPSLFFGTTANPGDAEGQVVVSLQIGQRLFAVYEFFPDGVYLFPGAHKTAGERTCFPLQDITDDVERLVQQYVNRGRTIGRGRPTYHY